MIKTNNKIEDAKRRIILSLKGSKKKPYDWLSIAEDVALLRQNSFSIKDIAEIGAVSEQTIRQILKLNELTKENKQRILENKILMDAASRLAGIIDKELQNQVGKIIENMKSHEQRDIIQYAKKNPSISKIQLNKFRRDVLKSKPIVKDLNIVIFSLENDLYDKLKNESKKNKISISKQVVSILNEWSELRKKR